MVSVTDAGDNYSVALSFSPPELSNYVFKFGKPDVTNVPITQMAIYLPSYYPFKISKASLPVKLCVIGYDAAGNATKPYEQTIDK